MIDLDVFQQELAKLSEWDAQGMRYGYEIDVEYINGRVQRNESGTRKNRADDFQKDVERLARDNRVGRIFVRLFRGTSTNAKRMDTTKAITDDTPDIVLRVNSESLAASLATNKKDEATHTSAGGMGAQDSSLGGLLGTLLGVGSGLSGVDVVNGIVESRINGVRRDMENERLQEKYAEAKAQVEAGKREVERLQRELDGMEREKEELLEQVDELKKYDPRTGQGVMGLAMHLGSVALGRLAKNYATKNPQRFAGLFGPDMLALVGEGPSETTQQPPTESGGTPRVRQIASWLNTRSAAEVDKVYRLVTLWDGNPTALDAMVDMANAPQLRAEELHGNEEEE